MQINRLPEGPCVVGPHTNSDGRVTGDLKYNLILPLRLYEVILQIKEKVLFST